MVNEEDKNFNKWLQQFIKDSGHQWGFGFYIETIDGNVFHQGTEEYDIWFKNKEEEYKNK
jgi:hypothetical protein